MKWFRRHHVEDARPSRAERAAKVAELRSQGLTGEAIAERLDISRSYAHSLISDPDGSCDKERKRRYAGVCRSCGGPTDGSNGRGKAPEHCHKCAGGASQYWTRERIIGAIQRFARENGRPPIANEWLKKGPGKPDYAPYAESVQQRFGSWANAIEAAGFQRPTRGHNLYGNKNGYRVSTEDLIERIKEAAEIVMLAPSSAALAETYNLLRYRGISWDQACEMAGCRPRKGSRKVVA